MNTFRPSVDRIRAKLDEHLNRNDYAAAERHLLYWLSEAKNTADRSVTLFVENELMGINRKMGKRDQAVAHAEEALRLLAVYRMEDTLTAATTALNVATVYKAFSMPERALPLFSRARQIYEARLPSDDPRLAGLYNNTALALVDVGRFAEARDFNEKALSVLQQCEGGSPEIAITYLNMASAAEQEHGAEAADEEITELLRKGRALLDACNVRDGNYAFVCEKCASVFGYYGYFVYEQELLERSRRIYEGN